MLHWLENLSFGDFVLSISLFIAAIGAYFNLDSKVNSVVEKLNEVEQSQSDLSRDLKNTELEHKKELLEIRASSDTRFKIIEERQRITDVFIGRFDEKMNYLVEQLKQLTLIMEKRNDK